MYRPMLVSLHTSTGAVWSVNMTASPAWVRMSDSTRRCLTCGREEVRRG
jgi:hypothetical protein